MKYTVSIEINTTETTVPEERLNALGLAVLTFIDTMTSAGKPFDSCPIVTFLEVDSPKYLFQYGQPITEV